MILPTPSWKAVAGLARDFAKVVAEQDWKPAHHAETNMSYQLPRKTVTQIREGRDTMFSDVGGALQVRTLMTPQIDARSMHGWVAANTAGGKPDYVLERSDRLVSASRLVDGISVYLRSDKRGAEFATTSIQWIPARDASARLTIASLRAGKQGAYRYSKDGVLIKAVDRLNALDSTPAKPNPPAVLGKGSLAGTGFYINNTDLVTAQAVANNCRAMALQDGTPLSPLAAAEARGLVLLTSPRRSEHWIAIGAEKTPGIGQDIAVRRLEAADGRPAKLTARTGAVITIAEFAEKTVRLLVSVPTSRVQTGAPVFDDNNALVGVMVGRPAGAELRFARHLSFVAAASKFATALERSRVLFEPAKTGAGARPAIADEAIVPIYCR